MAGHLPSEPSTVGLAVDSLGDVTVFFLHASAGFGFTPELVPPAPPSPEESGPECGTCDLMMFSTLE